MSYDFPNAPVENQTYTPAGGPTYMWKSPRWLVDTTNLTFNNVTIAGTMTIAGTIVPAVNNTIDLGSAALRWRTIYTGDLSLKNEVGDWTIVEGADDLFITNNRTGKRYKFALVEAPDGD